MTSPRAATSTADRTHVRRRNWAGEPALLLGEDARGYDELLAEVSRVLVPHDVIEDMWIRDVVGRPGRAAPPPPKSDPAAGAGPRRFARSARSALQRRLRPRAGLVRA